MVGYPFDCNATLFPGCIHRKEPGTACSARGSRGNTIAGSYPGTDAGANASRYANANRNAGRYAGNEKGDAKARIQYAAGVCTAYDAQRHFLY